MKNLILFLAFVPLTLSAQNIPNPGFESWQIGNVILEADDWRSSNFYTFNQFGVYSANPDWENFTEGISSVRLSTSILDTLGPFAAFMISGWPMLDYETNELDIMSGGTPFSYRPTKMTGQYQFESNSPIEDFAQAHVILKKYNAVTGERDTIGYGQNILLNPTAGFQTFEVPIQYLVPDVTPDSIIVILYSTHPNAPTGGGELWVDELSFEITNDVSEVEDLSEVKIFPNPFNEFFKVEITAERDGQFELIDINGRKIVEKTINKGPHVLEFDLNGLASGNYFLSWRSESGRSFLLEKLVKVD